MTDRPHLVGSAASDAPIGTANADRAPADQAERERAVDPSQSFVVQAPAGSGKTTLLAERFLRLLATVDEPEEVLAITFTRAAAAEMQARIHTALRRVAEGTLPKNLGEERMAEAAAKALAHSEERGWNLLDDPRQLNVQTIDGLALTIAQQTPLTSRLGPGFAPTENATAFYERAAMRTMQSLEDARSENVTLRQTAEAAATLLRHRDNRLGHCAELLADMLQYRDQWGRVFPLDVGSLEDETLDAELRPRLEGFLRAAVDQHLQTLSELLLQEETLCRELVRLARFAAVEATGGIANCRDLLAMPRGSFAELAVWLGLAELVLTKKATARKKYTIDEGFRAGVSTKEKQEMTVLAASLCESDELRRMLHEVRSLPPVAYSDEEWVVAKALLRLLLRGALQLKLLFADSGMVDFTEVGLAAIDALTEEEREGWHPSELGFALGARYRHLLVDEFQDTSRTQYRLLELLLGLWQAGDGRTLFCVGDPMQSIYLFRQAELRLFSQVRDHGIGEVRPQALTLKVNFRSQPALVEEHNRLFSEVFVQQKDVEFVASEAYAGIARENPVRWHFFLKEKKDAGSLPVRDANEEEARRAVDLVADAIAAGNAANEKTHVAVLVRVKNHASMIMQGLRERGIRYRATDMESLADRQEVLDVFAVTRALLHAADRVAWLSVLRGPWCGLSLAGLDALAGERSHATVRDLMASRLEGLTESERTRVRRVQQVFDDAEACSHTARLPTLVWDTWRALGGEVCVNAEQWGNVTAYFALLERMDAEGRTFRCDTIDEEIKRLCAQPDPDAAIQVDVMTIHKAKGQEFDVVIVPQMERVTYRGSAAALDWMADGADEVAALYLAPIAASGEDNSALKEWICARKKEREHAEVKRLLYVAATRARTSVHMMGAVAVNKDGALTKPQAGTLLEAAWCVAEAEATRQLVGPMQADLMPAGPLPTVRMQVQPAVIETLAAVAELQPILRLPDAWFATSPASPSQNAEPRALAAGTPVADMRPQRSAETLSGAETRLAGTALHRMLEAAAMRRARGQSWEALTKWAGESTWRLRSALLASGIPSSRADSHAANVLALLQKALTGEHGRWVMEDHAGARNEFSLTFGQPDGESDVRLDRIFSAGPAPLTLGDSHLWIVDYKSAAVGGRDVDSFLSTQREAYWERMQLYATSLRAALQDPRPIVCALYFPAIDLVHVVSE